MKDGHLTEDDFDSYEGWLRHCHEGGIDLARDDEGFSGISGSGFYAGLLGGIYGHSRRQYERAWLGRGQTSGIDRASLQKAYRAVAFANCLGCLMNTRMDITWSTAGVTSDVIVAARQRRFLDLLQRWFVRNGQVGCWVWVLERGERHGLHTHMLLSVPDRLYFGPWPDRSASVTLSPFKAYVRSTLAAIVKTGLVDTPKTKTLKIQRGNSVIGQWRRFDYMTKGFSQDAGQVAVKRLGVSRALDKKAVRDWNELLDFPNMSIPAEDEPLYDDRFLRWHADHEPVFRELGKNGRPK